VEDECALSPTPLDSPFIFTSGKSLLYQPVHLLRTKQKPCLLSPRSIFFPQQEGKKLRDYAAAFKSPDEAQADLTVRPWHFATNTIYFTKKHIVLPIQDPALLHTHSISHKS